MSKTQDDDGLQRGLRRAVLRDAESRYQQAMADADEAREARRLAVINARDAGWTYAEIGAVMGLSRGRIGQIVQTTKVT